MCDFTVAAGSDRGRLTVTQQPQTTLLVLIDSHPMCFIIFIFMLWLTTQRRCNHWCWCLLMRDKMFHPTFNSERDGRGYQFWPYCFTESAQFSDRNCVFGSF